MPGLLTDIKDIERFDEILAVFFEEGFGSIIYELRFHRHLKLSHRIRHHLGRRTMDAAPVRLRRALERLGPTFIKLGQILSVRPDLVPPDYIKELRKLQEQVTPLPFSSIQSTIEGETGKKLASLFSSFERKPLATASISQVHRAVLAKGGTVAVKVQKPGIENLIERDIDILFFIAHLLARYSNRMRNYDPVTIVKEFAAWTYRELDFTIEARNIDRFSKNLAGSRVVIPKVYSPYTTKRLLVMSFEKGEHIYSYHFPNTAAKRRFIDAFAEVLFLMIFRDGFFHADPHAGNVFVTKKNLPLLLDFGMVGTLSPAHRTRVTAAFTALNQHDTDQAVEELLTLASRREDADVDGFREDARELIEYWYSQPIGKCSFITTFYQVIAKGAASGLVFDASIVLLAKSMVDLEGIAMQVSPDSNVEEVFKPYIQRMILDRYNPAKVLGEAAKSLQKHRELYTELPENVTRLIEKLETGNFDFRLDAREVESFTRHMDGSSNRRALAYVIAALFLSSAFFFYADQRLDGLGVTLGLAELAVAAVLLVYLVRQVVSSNHQDTSERR